MIQFIDRLDPDEVSMMYPRDYGEWVKYKDVEAKIEGYKEALKQLRNCNAEMMTSGQLNDYVDGVLSAV